MPGRIEKTMRLVSPVGPYTLDMGLDHLYGLSEFSYLEYLAIPKVFVDEKIYTAPDIDFLGFTWNLALAVKDGRIYKISPQILTRNPDEATRAFVSARKHLVGEMGEPTERDGPRLIWRIAPGNVILEHSGRLGVHCVQFFITGGAAFLNAPTGSKMPAHSTGIRSLQTSSGVLNAVALFITFVAFTALGYWIVKRYL